MNSTTEINANDDYEVTQSQKDRMLSELDRLAMDFAYSKENEMRIDSLKFEERAYVMTMAHLYFLYGLGAVSKEKCIKQKQKALNDYRQIHTELYFLRIEHNAWLRGTHELRKDYNILVDQINNSNKEVLSTALKIIDKLSRHNIYKKLYMAAQSEITQSNITTMIDNCDKLPEKVDKQTAEYIFYKWLGQINDDGTLHTFKSLSDEELEKISKILPQKESYVEIPKDCIPQ